MLVIVPVTQADAHRADELAEAMQINTPGRNQSLVVVAAKNCEEDAKEVCEKLAPYFLTAREYIFAQESDIGWPRTMNFLFQQTCYFLRDELPANQGWLWLELDCTPLKPKWLDAIETAYYADANNATREGRAMHRFMGVKQQTVRGFQGELMPFEQSGMHMAAVGVYPANMNEITPLIPAITGGNQTFYTKLQWYSTKSLNETKLIQNNWRTVRYRKVGDKIMCDSWANWAWDVHFNEPIHEDCVLLHGCKDNTLLKLIRKPEPKVEPSNWIVVEDVSITSSETTTPVISTEVSEMLVTNNSITPVYVENTEQSFQPMPVGETVPQEDYSEKFPRVAKRQYRRKKKRKVKRKTKSSRIKTDSVVEIEPPSLQPEQ